MTPQSALGVSEKQSGEISPRPAGPVQPIVPGTASELLAV